MREIEFRGISVDTNKFEYGLLVFMVGMGSWAIEQTFDCPPTLSDPGGSSDYKRHEIKNNTQGQFTGLKDKKGTKIFDKDIVMIDGLKYVIDKGIDCKIYDFREFNTDYDDKDYDLNYHNGDYLSDFNLNHIEIIGNIHQDKHLLK